MKYPQHNLLILPVILVICFAACSEGKIKTLQAPQDNMEKLATANNDFALKIHRRLASASSDNVFFSPFSLSTAFGMLYHGTKGKTAEELRKVLGYEYANLSDDLVHQTFHKYLTEYFSSNDSSPDALKFANAILHDKRLNIMPSYKKEVQHLYQASIIGTDFMSASSQALKEVNSWVSEKTNGKIDRLIENLDPFTVLIILNAVYFKGTWQSQFEANLTEPDTFFNNGFESKSKEVPMMRMTAYLFFNDAFDGQAFELPYKENVSMVVFLPYNLDGLESLEKNLTLDKFSTIRNGMSLTKVNLTFPKFKLDYSREMSSDFRHLGANEIFNPSRADFSGMTSQRASVSEVIHKAVLEVNEEGSEAAAATGTMWGRRRPANDKEREIIVDHPFMFAIVDTRNDLILFLGHVTNL